MLQVVESFAIAEKRVKQNEELESARCVISRYVINGIVIEIFARLLAAIRKRRVFRNRVVFHIGSGKCRTCREGASYRNFSSCARVLVQSEQIERPGLFAVLAFFKMNKKFCDHARVRA